MGKVQKIGLITSTSLVIGNMIGVGIFVLPAALASYGSISLLGWICTAAGALVLAKIFGNFSKIIVNKSGGPYTYARAGLGDFMGFLVAWGYWTSIWISNSAIAIAIVGALTFFFPALVDNSVLQVGLGLFFIWLFAFINSRGIKASGRIQVITTALKILPLLFVIIVGLFFFKFENFPDFNLTDNSNLDTLATVATFTLYAFLGIESATVPAENIENSETTVSRATMLGAIITTIIYILGTIVLFGILPIDQLQSSAAPFAEAAKIIGGKYSGYFVAVGVIISGLGVLNGWTLMMAQIPRATALDGLFPNIFAKENKQGAPIYGILIGSCLTSGLLLMNFSKGLVEQFKFIVDIAVFCSLLPYLFVATAYVLIIIENKLHFDSKIKTFLLGGIGFAFSTWALYGSGKDTVFYGFLLLILGIPFYLRIKWNHRNDA